MLSNHAYIALIDIRFNIILVGDFLRDLDFEAFENDLKTFHATMRALEIISEASRRLPDELKHRHPNTPWNEMRTAGNVYRRNDDRVAGARIWKTATDDLLPLPAIVEAELAAADRDRGRPEGI